MAEAQKQSTKRDVIPMPPGMDFNAFFKASPRLRPRPNIGCLFDIYTGRYYTGRHGESILNGGPGYTTGVAGEGNKFKSVLLHFIMLRVLDRYRRVNGQVYDTEGSIQEGRFYDLSHHLPNLSGHNLVDEGRLHLTDSPTMKGDVWYRAWRNYTDAKLHKDNVKAWTRPTPFWDAKEQKHVTTLIPTFSEIDSLSQFTTSGVQNIFDEKDIGTSEMNTEALRSSRDKSQMLMDMSDAAINTNSYVLMTAHVGPKHALDPRAPPSKQMQYLNNKLSLKHVPQKFTFTTNVLWFVVNAEIMRNDTTKAAEFPSGRDDDLKGDTDLQKLHVLALRNKYGASGMPFEIVISQDEGVMVGLTEFNYIRNFNRYGLGGNVQNYHLELYPDVNLSRTTIRTKIDEDVKLQRALEITSEMCQMNVHWDDDDKVMCTPKELYDDLKAIGYDWDVLLDTRGYWVYLEDEEGELPFLSTMDLLRMRKGLYVPYWLPKDKVSQLKIPKVESPPVA